MSDLDQLHALLNAVNVDDDMISRGVRLTDRGLTKVATKLNVAEEEVGNMLAQLAQQINDGNPPSHITEGRKRFAYEADFLGNVTLRDRKSGDVKELSGSEAFDIIAEIERVGSSFQSVIAPYFSKSLKESDGELLDIDAEMGGRSGTYNFPFKTFLATARFSVEHSKFKIEVISIRNQQGEEQTIDPEMKQEAQRVAKDWVDKA